MNPNLPEFSSPKQSVLSAVVFYTSSLYLVSFSLVASVLVLNLARQSHASKLPWPIKSFLTGPCGRVLLLNSYIEQVSQPPRQCPTRGVPHPRSIAAHEVFLLSR